MAMANNTFNNRVEITRSAAKVLEANLVLARYVNRGFDENFTESGAKHGDTLNIRLPGHYSATTGPVAVPNGYNDNYVQVKVTQKNTSILLTSAERALNVDDFETNVMQPLMAPIAQLIDREIADLVPYFHLATGTPGTAPTDLGAFLDAAASLDTSNAPRDGMRAAIMNQFSNAKIVNGLKTLFNPSADIARQYKEGMLGDIAGGMKWSMSQNLGSHTFGPLGGSPVVATVPADGASQIATSGWTASAASRLNLGDIFTIAGVYRVNPIDFRVTSELQQFRVTEAFSSDGSGTGTVKIDPPIRVSGNLQNCSALPAQNAVITPLSAANKVGAINAVFHRDAIAMAVCPLRKVPNSTQVRIPRLGLTVRVTDFYNGTQDTELTRIDVLSGAALYRPDLGVQVFG